MVKESLAEIQKHYVIIVYTASHQSYADSVLDFLDPDKEFIKYRLYRHNCVRVKIETEFIYVKDMRIFRNVHPKDIVMIDNSVLSFAHQLENGIPILPFYNNKEDYELTFLTNYLVRIAKSDDLRVENKKCFKMDYFLQAAVDEISIYEIEDEADISIEKGYIDKEEKKQGDSSDPKNLFALNVCSENNSSDNSLDISLNNSYNSFNNEANPGVAGKKKYTQDFKRNSCIQDELLNTLVELKKSLEENLKKKKVDK